VTAMYSHPTVPPTREESGRSRRGLSSSRTGERSTGRRQPAHAEPSERSERDLAEPAAGPGADDLPRRRHQEARPVDAPAARPGRNWSPRPDPPRFYHPRGTHDCQSNVETVRSPVPAGLDDSTAWTVDESSSPERFQRKKYNRPESRFCIGSERSAHSRVYNSSKGHRPIRFLIQSRQPPQAADRVEAAHGPTGGRTLLQRRRST